MFRAKRTNSHCFRVTLLALAALSMRCNKKPDSSGPNLTEPRAVTVAAAASMKSAVGELVAEFQKSNPKIRINVTYGSSGSLFAQITNHAPFDFFLSADAVFPERLIESDLAIKNSRFQYAIGGLVVWTRNDSKLDPTQTGIQILINSAVRKIAIANPKLAPYGRAAESAMKKLGVYDQAKTKLVLAENVAQAAQFVESGAADIGIIARSLAEVPPLRDRGRYWPVPPDTHEPIVHEGVILNRVVDEAAANQLRNFILSRRGGKILKKHGFDLPGE